MPPLPPLIITVDTSGLRRELARIARDLRIDLAPWPEYRQRRLVWLREDGTRR